MLAFDHSETSGRSPFSEEAEPQLVWRALKLVRRSAEVLSLPGCASGARQDLLLRVFREHEPDLRRFLRARGASGADCDDLTQEAFLRLARQDDLELRLSSNPCKIRAYLIVVASNLVYDMHRRSVTRQAACHASIEDVTLVDRNPTPEQAMAIQQTLAAVQAVLAALEPKCGQAFKMSRFDNMSYQEIAGRLEVSVSMVEKYVAKALIAVRSQVDCQAVRR